MNVRVAARSAVLASVFLLLGGVAGTNAAVQGSANAWTTPHVLTISDGGDLNTLNPHLTQSAPVANLSELTMAWLVRWDEHNKPYPELATQVPTQANGGVSKDGLSITYHLRRGVRWSDGAPFDADDVVFSTGVVDNLANNEGGRFDQLASVSAPNESTVVFRLKKPYASFVEAFFSSCCANPSILPKHLLAKYANINDVPYNSLPVGIGPFKFDRWERGKQVVLVANTLYWRGRPKLDKIVYKIVPNRDALLAQLAHHKVDMWYQFSGAYLAPIQALHSFTIVRHPSYAYSHFDFNLTHAAVADPVVRRALRLALDRHGIINRFAHGIGIGIVQDSATPDTAPYFVDLGTTPYDLVSANAMLDAAGWVRGPDGIRAKNGVKLSLTAAIPEGQPDTDRQLAFVASDWKQAGVDLHVKRYPQALMFASPKQGGIVFGNNEWDVVVFTWAADPLGDFSGNYGCKAFPPSGSNNLRWCNGTAERAMDALAGHYPQAQRTNDIKILMQQFVKDAPSIVTAIREDMFAYNPSLKNYQPNNLTPFDNMMNVDI